MKKYTVALSLLLLIFCSHFAMAGGGEKGDFELGVYGGGALLDDYLGLNPKDSGLVGARFGYFFTPRLSLEVSYQKIFSKTQVIPATIPQLDLAGLENIDLDINSARLNLLWNFRQCKKIRPFVTLGAGYEEVQPKDLDSNTDLGFNVGGGARFFVVDWFAVRLDGRIVATDFSQGQLSDWQNNIEVGLGASFLFGAPVKDTDGDGVGDCKDKCDNTTKGCIVDETGCPKDTDGDGVCDGLDACPDTPKGCAVDARGCPIDADGDGVIDCNDRCPNTPKGCKVDASGCPVDSDGDGVCDGIDKCPDTPKGCKVDATGCPMDSDGDGVCDGIDKCPDTPRGAKVDATGCPIPEPKPEIFQGKPEMVLEGVTFPTDKWQLTAEDKTILDKAVTELKQYPEVKIEVQGHTDSTDGDSWNMTLSQRRAESVMKYLVEQGIPASQLTAKGYGKTQPIADNKTKEGRAQNRRSVLHKVE